MKKIIITYIILFALFLILVPIKLAAFTIVTDATISEDSHWTKQGSPYILLKDLLISPVATLVIDPGVIIKSDNAYVEVYGTVIASGTPEEKIYFTSHTDDSLGGDSNNDGIKEHDNETHDARGWYFYESSNHSVLKNIVLRYSSDGFYFDSTDMLLQNIFIEHSQFGITANKSNISADTIISTDSGTTLLLYKNSKGYISSSTILNAHNNAITSNNSTIYISDSVVYSSGDFQSINLSNSTGTVTSVQLNEGNLSGIYSYKSHLNLNNSVISNFKQSGIHISDGVTNISSSTIKYNRYGIYFQVSSVKVLSLFRRIVIKVSMMLFPKLYADTAPVSIFSNNITENFLYGIFNSSSLIVSARQNYWGTDTGPLHPIKNQNGEGNQVSDNIDFRPWIQLKPQYSSCCSNIIFFPGIESSRLYKKSLYGEDKLWEPNINADIQDLLLDSSGKSIKKDIYTSEIIKQEDVLGLPYISLYKKFTDAMDDLVTSKRINSWHAIPYDWRLSIEDAWTGIKLKNSIANIEDEIVSLASTSKTGKVILIGHSNGGLLAKYVIKKLEDIGKINLIDKLILVASPQFGTPGAISALLYGDGQALAGGILISQSLARSFSEHMQTVYTLLPSSLYPNDSTEPFIVFNPSVNSILHFQNENTNKIVSTEDLKSFLVDNSRYKPVVTDVGTPNVLSTFLTNYAVNFHSLLDVFIPTSSIKTYQFIGFGRNTTSGVKYFAHTLCSFSLIPCSFIPQLDHKNIKTLDGDGTITLKSTDIHFSNNTYFLNLKELNKDISKNYSHSTIFEAQSLIESLKNIITNEASYQDKYLTSALQYSKQIKRLELSVHSPVSLSITNNAGQYTGIVTNSNSDIRYAADGVPNSSYEETGEGKYIFLDDVEHMGTIKVLMKGLDKGTFTYEQSMISETASSTTVFANVAVTSSTTAEIILNSNPNPTSTIMLIDQDGDGTIDRTLYPSEQQMPLAQPSESSAPMPVSASQYGSSLNYLVRTYVDPLTHLVKTYFCIPILNALKSI